MSITNHWSNNVTLRMCPFKDSTCSGQPGNPKQYVDCVLPVSKDQEVDLEFSSETGYVVFLLKGTNPPTVPVSEFYVPSSYNPSTGPAINLLVNTHGVWVICQSNALCKEMLYPESYCKNNPILPPPYLCWEKSASTS